MSILYKVLGFDLQNTSLLPKPLDQGSHLNNAILLVKMCHTLNPSRVITLRLAPVFTVATE